MRKVSTHADDDTIAPRHRRRGFTLVELLVVVGIIAVLIGILMPVITRARQSAITAQCAANMKAIGAGYIAYYADHDGVLLSCAESVGGSPAPGTTQYGAWILWVTSSKTLPVSTAMEKGAIVPYLSVRGPQLISLFRCPSIRLAEDIVGFDSSTGAIYPLTYAMNGFSAPSVNSPYKNHYGNVPPIGPWRIGKILTPETHIFLYDNDQYGTDDKFWYANSADVLCDRHGVAVPQTLNGAIVTRGQGNVAFFDGHVELVTNDLCHDATRNDPMVK